MPDIPLDRRSLWTALGGYPFSQGWVDAKGVRMCYLHTGSTGKPAIVLLHGVIGSAEAFVYNVGAYSEHLDCYAIDLLGNGYTDKSDDDVKTHIPSSTHRAPGANQMGFMAESFVDEMAIAGGWDPLEWCIKMTEGLPNWQLVLKTLKEKSGFRTDLPKGEGMGVAVVESHGTIAAACATVRVSRRGRLNIEKVLVVLDAGSRHQSECRRRAVRGVRLLGALPCLDGWARVGERPLRQHPFRHRQPARHRPEPACRDSLRDFGRKEMGRSRRASRPARLRLRPSRTRSITRPASAFARHRSVATI